MPGPIEYGYQFPFSVLRSGRYSYRSLSSLSCTYIDVCLQQGSEGLLYSPSLNIGKIGLEKKDLPSFS